MKVSPPILCTLLAMTGAAQAQLVYEPFSYGVANGATINGVTTNATGLTGNYGVANTNGGSSTYTTTGLTFSSNFFPTSGGALVQSGTSTVGTSSSSVAGIALATGPVTGTVYSSFLFSPTAESPIIGALATSRINTTLTGTGGYFLSQADGGGGVGAPAVAYDGTATTTATTLSLATTYLAVSRLTNVGLALSAGTPGNADLFVFTLSAYDNWFNAGAEESQLATFATVSVSDAPVTTGTFAMSNSQFVQFNLSTANDGTAGRVQTYAFDELRYGTTLAQVATVPEPTTGLMLLGGLGALLGMRRGRRLS